MLSRVADSLYWMNRYLERAENVARFIHVNLHLMLDMPGGADGQWQPLIRTTGDDALFAELHGEASQEKVMLFLTFDTKNPNSILSCIRRARENARCIRETISSEMWETLNHFYLKINNPAAPKFAAENPHDFYNDVRTSIQLFDGVTNATMSHGEGYHFARMGKMLERADKTSRILDVKYFILLPQVDYVGTPYDNIQWAALLKSASALEMYRKKYPQISPLGVSEFLISNPDFPRAILFCLIRTEESMKMITGASPSVAGNAAEKRLKSLRAEVAKANIKEIIKAGLHEYLDSFQISLNTIDDSIYTTFLATRAPDESTIPGLIATLNGQAAIQTQSQSQSIKEPVA